MNFVDDAAVSKSQRLDTPARLCERSGVRAYTCLDTKKASVIQMHQRRSVISCCGTQWGCQRFQISSFRLSSQALGERFLNVLLIIYFTSFSELNPTSGSLPSTTPMSPSAISTQNLVMSSSGVGGDASVTLTLADTQGMLSGGLDTVTLNITSQVSVLQGELLGPFEKAS